MTPSPGLHHAVRAAALLWLGLCCSAAGAAETAALQTPASAQTPSQIRAQAMQLAHSGNVQSFPVTAENCTRGMSTLRQSTALFAQIQDSSTTSQFIQVRLAQCEALLGQAASAVQRLRALLQTPQTSPTMHNLARRALAPLYAQGLGVEQDKERALGLYLMSDLDDHERRAAAQLLQHMPGSSLPAYYRLLEQGSLPGNWLMALQTRQQRNENRYEITRLALRALRSAPGAETADERQAHIQLREIAGTGLAHWDSSRYAAAWVLLSHVATPSAAQELQRLQEQWPFTVTHADGQPWQANPTVQNQ